MFMKRGNGQPPPQQHRGEIKVETEEGTFTEFLVRLPRAGF